MVKQATELRYAVRIPIVSKYFGQLCLILALLNLVPLIASFLFNETTISLRYIIVIIGLLSLGFPLARMKYHSQLQQNEGIVLVAVMFLFTPLVMTYPLMSSGLSFIDALFESISGITTTGLSTIATLADTPKTFLFARSWMQWYGGLGILVFTLALIVQPGITAKSLSVTENISDDLVGGTRAHSRLVIRVYSAITLIGIIGALTTGVTPIKAIEYTFAAVSTGGFAPVDSSLAKLNLSSQVWISLLCLFGAIPLTFYRWISIKKRKLSMDLLQLEVMILFIILSSLLVGTFMQINSTNLSSWSETFLHAPILAISAQTTAGFSSLALDQLSAGSKLALIFSMVVGGGLGSTAGGLKLFRLLIVASVFRLILIRTCLPKHSVITARLKGHKLEQEDIHAALLFIILFIVVIALSWLPFVAMGYDPLDSLFEVASATGTVGLSVGITNEKLPNILKVILCFDMLMGRLEIFAWIVMFYPGTWFGRKMEAK